MQRGAQEDQGGRRAAREHISRRQAPEIMGGLDSMWVEAEVQAARKGHSRGQEEKGG